jgi:lysophospholipid acyltransferase (LPLAT)-like uncharacterized protein
MKKWWKEIRHQLLKILTPAVGLVYFYVVGKTSKTGAIGQEQLDVLRKQYPHCIYAGWHEQILTGAWALRCRGITILISQSRDGEYVSRLVHLLGFHTIRGSSSRGGVRSLLKLVRVLKNEGDVIIIADGPRGPARECKPGVITLAKRSGMPIIPTAVLVSRFKRVNSWDRTIIPYPFSTFTMIHADPIFIPEDADKKTIAQYQAQLKQALDALSEKAFQQNVRGDV